MGHMLESSPIRQLPEDPDSLEAQLPRLAAEGKLEGAAREAIERQKAKGLAITFLRGSSIIKQYPDGSEEVLGTLAKDSEWTPSHTLTTDIP